MGGDVAGRRPGERLGRTAAAFAPGLADLTDAGSAALSTPWLDSDKWAVS